MKVGIALELPPGVVVVDAPLCEHFAQAWWEASRVVRSVGPHLYRDSDPVSLADALVREGIASRGG